MEAKSTTYRVQEKVEVSATSKRTSGLATAQGAAKNCILVHGWNADKRSMENIQNALMQFPEANQWTFWNVEYDTHWRSFAESAGDIMNYLSGQKADFSLSIIIGYSLGGVIARKMISNGFPCRALVTVCAPHEGLALWIPTPDRGTMSIAPWSDDLKALNASGDVGSRSSYSLFGITSHDMLGDHEDDGVVTFGSAIGADLRY